jgi:hypothetical protein
MTADAPGEVELVGVASVADRAEADMIQGLLDTAGIQSTVQQTGIDGPRLGFGWLNPGGGSQRVMVRSDQAEAARALLEGTTVNEAADSLTSDEYLEAEEATGGRLRNYGLFGAYARIWAWSFGSMALAFGIFLLLRAT